MFKTLELVMKFFPKFLRAAYRFAMQVALSEWEGGTEVISGGAWHGNYLCLLARMLLHKSVRDWFRRVRLSRDSFRSTKAHGKIS